jgi:putative membrane protein
MVVIEIAIIARSFVDFDRTRGAIDRDEAIQIQHSRTQSLLSVALAIAVVIFCIYLAVLYYNLGITLPIPFDIGFLPTYN